MTCRLRWCGRNRNQMQNSNMADVWVNSMACHPRAAEPRHNSVQGAATGRIQWHMKAPMEKWTKSTSPATVNKVSNGKWTNSIPLHILGNFNFFSEIYVCDLVHFSFVPFISYVIPVSQSHVSHCRVLPLGEFTVTIPEPNATLQSHACAVTWRNQCHDRATLKIVFRHILFF